MERNMDQHLQQLIALAQKHIITKEEHEAQVRSFTYGNTHLENEAITREEVDVQVKLLSRQTLPWEVAAK
jgi:hypothetical protein